MNVIRRLMVFQLGLLVGSAVLLISFQSPAQWPFAAPTNPSAQRNAMTGVRSQVNWLQSATRTAVNYGEAGYGNVQQMFDRLRQTFNGFKQSLTPQQLTQGANHIAELDAGLDILQEAFVNYQEDRASGQPVGPALRNLCADLRQGSAVWLQEFNKICSRLRVGWG